MCISLPAWTVALQGGISSATSEVLTAEVGPVRLVLLGVLPASRKFRTIRVAVMEVIAVASGAIMAPFEFADAVRKYV